jgi:hypothetical protein
MNETNNVSPITSIITWGLWAITSVMMAGILFAPVFLPTIESALKKKYENFTHKESLIKEEMSSYRALAWIGCILGWILFLSIAAFSNYGG